MSCLARITSFCSDLEDAKFCLLASNEMVCTFVVPKRIAFDLARKIDLLWIVCAQIMAH